MKKEALHSWSAPKLVLTVTQYVCQAGPFIRYRVAEGGKKSLALPALSYNATIEIETTPAKLTEE